MSEGVRDGRPRVVNRRVALVALLAAAVVLAFVAVCQLVLPGIATGRIRSMLSRSGSVRSVSVSAWPAVELLWHHADSVTISMRSYSATAVRLDRDLGQLRDVGTLHASIGTVHVSALRVHRVSFAFAGGRMDGRALVLESDLRGAVPFLNSVVPVTSANGKLVLRGTASVLGVLGGSVDATVQARNGALIASPDVPLGGLATVTVFSARGVRVTGVSAVPAPGGFVARLTGILR